MKFKMLNNRKGLEEETRGNVSILLRRTDKGRPVKGNKTKTLTVCNATVSEVHKAIIDALAEEEGDD